MRHQECLEKPKICSRSSTSEGDVGGWVTPSSLCFPLALVCFLSTPSHTPLSSEDQRARSWEFVALNLCICDGGPLTQAGKRLRDSGRRSASGRPRAGKESHPNTARAAPALLGPAFPPATPRGSRQRGASHPPGRRSGARSPGQPAAIPGRPAAAAAADAEGTSESNPGT